MAKIKFGNLLKTAASFIPGAGPWVAAADALFSRPKSPGLGGFGGAFGLQAANPFIKSLEGRIPESERLFDDLIGASEGLHQRATSIDDEALLEQFIDDATTRLLPRMVESATSGPLAGLVSRGIGTSGTLGQNIVSRAAQDVTESLITQAMQRRLAIPDQQLAREMAVLDEMAQLAGLVSPTREFAALLPAITQGGLGAAQLGMEQQGARAKGLSSLLSGLNPGRDFGTFSDWIRGRLSRPSPSMTPVQGEFV